MFLLGLLANLILRPANLLVLVLAAASGMLFTRRQHIGRQILAGLSIFCLIILLLPVDKWLAAPLESRFSALASVDRVDGIVVLGGSFDRILSAAALARAAPNAKLIVAGGSENERMPFGDRGKSVLVRLGISADRVLSENRSLNTWEDLQFAKELAVPKPEGKWLLVTSAVHMPRAMGVAQHLGWPMIPAPTEFISRVPVSARLDFAQKAVSMGDVLHEYAGLLVYYLEGRLGAQRPQAATKT